MVPPAPGRFSTTMVWPQRLLNSSPMVRATMSTAPPGGKGTSRCTGLDGKVSCANAAPDAIVIAASAASVPVHRLMMLLPPSAANPKFARFLGRNGCEFRVQKRHQNHRVASCPFDSEVRSEVAGNACELRNRDTSALRHSSVSRRGWRWPENKNPAIRGGVSWEESPIRSGENRSALRRNARLVVRRLAQHIAAAPDGLDVVLAVRRVGELLAQLADEHVDDLEFGLVHAAVEMVEEHLLGEGRAVDLDGLRIEVDDEIAGLDDRLGMPLGAPHDRVDARHQLVLVEWLGHVVVGAEAEALDLVLDAGEAGEDEDRRLDLGDPQRAQHLEPGHVREVQVEQDDVVIIELAKVDALFAEVRRVDVEALGFQHQLDRLRSRAIVFDQ